MKVYYWIFHILLISSISNAQEVISDVSIIKQIERDTINIDQFSTISLFIKTSKKVDGKFIPTTTATGFIYKKNKINYLITNWHVVSGKNVNGKPQVTPQGIDISNPERLEIFFHRKTLGEWKAVEIELYKNQKPIWLEHPKGKEVDVVAIPLKLRSIDDILLELYPINEVRFDDDLLVFPSMEVSIIGFPYGFSSFGKLPIWKTGQISTDFDIDIRGLPLFYIDAATRGGMSGSPVICRTSSYNTKNGYVIRAGGYAQKFLGIYSGRLLPGDSDIGLVWKVECLDEIIK